MKCFKKATAIVLALLMLVSLLSVGGASVFAISGGGSKGTGSILSWGCDMSFYNVSGGSDYSLVDYNLMKSDGCEYVILRIGYEGTVSRANTIDPAFVKLYNMARAAGMKVGVYFYALAKDYAGAVEDAQWCIDIFEENNMYFEYPIYYDVEDPGSSSRPSHESLTSAETTSLCLGWAETLANAGYFPGVYAGYYVLNDLTSAYTSHYDTWIASVLSATNGSQYNPNVDKVSFRSNYGAWQYKWYSAGGVQSYKGSYWKDSYGYPLDCNVSFKDYPNIMQTYGYNNMVTKHKITFETNGGSAVSPAYVTDGNTLTAPTAPTKYAFTFGGWYTDAALTDLYDFNTKVPYDFTLYAKWDEAYWSAQTNLMPTEQQLTLNSFNDQGAIWPYYGTDGSVTFYNGVTNAENWSWPSAYMEYENSFDAVGDTYLYIKKEGTAMFNVVLTYLDQNGTAHDLYLSDVANITDSTDFAAGYLEDAYNVGSYIRNIGHAPASGNVKFTKVTYFIIGEKDSYVKLHDLKFTSTVDIPDPYETMMSSNITQLSGSGNYEYNNGTLTMTATGENGYSLKMNTNKTFNPGNLRMLLADINSTVPFNVTVELTGAAGTMQMKFTTEFFDVFELTAAPDFLPAGDWNVGMNLIGYYEWNGGVIANSTVKSVTVSLKESGTLTMEALQASRNNAVEYVHDGAYTHGSLSEDEKPYVSGDVNGDGVVSTIDARVAMLHAIGGTQLIGNALAAGDMNGDGAVTTIDARLMMLSALTT